MQRNNDVHDLHVRHSIKRIDPSYATTITIVTALLSYGLVTLIRKVFEREVSFV